MISDAVDDLTKQFDRTHITSVSATHRILNAHNDDIHGMLHVAPGVFASGSKDNTVKLWDVAGSNLVTCSSDFQRRGYEYWVTALAKVSETSFASGTRNGCITVWDAKGNELRSFAYTPSNNSKSQTISKNRNKQRINCIAANSFGKQNTFFTGTPRFIQLWDATSGKIMSYWQAHANDWVYCVEPLSRDSIIVVIGSTMNVWSHIYKRSPQVVSVIAEEKNSRESPQRPHISSIARLSRNSNELACTLFDGSVRIADIAHQSILQEYREHKGRVWSVVELRPHLLASCADDATIKLWDTRTDHSIHTIGNNPGRVSSLLKIDDNCFISGSCPDKVFESKEKASITFWDISKLQPQ